MNNIKSQFSIKDLENLTGIKAHTIRIWEKRYGLLEPSRTETNIRFYDLKNFQKLLNVSYLNQNGYKISKIANLPEENIPVLVKEISMQSDSKEHVLNSFKMSMLNFDQTLFYKTYNSISEELNFSEIFKDYFIPLLKEIGLLWQTNTITPSHEHFISGLIRQKIGIHTEILQSKANISSSKTFVLFLPEHEVHELGLLYLNYELIAHKHHSIFLGQSVPLNSLSDVIDFYDNITFISYFTVMPQIDDINDYLKEFESKIITDKKHEFWILGRRIESIDLEQLPKSISTFESIEALVKKL
ncbi:MAG: MerR family transcriptional regulator [Bacteroidetes bacterium MedPE-SWsnd-G2]|nr:MAG: MerR family transcriptional regulator [Bacteroidetes bacterium MedPE-SWsnd-G2]